MFKYMKLSQPYVISALAIGSVVVMAAVVVYAVYVKVRPSPPPIHYTQAEYLPERPVYAPGESMVYSPTLTLQRAGRVNVLRTYWSRTKDANASLCSGLPAPVIEISRNFPAATVGNVRGGSRVQLIVPNLPPGDYWLISSAAGPDGAESYYSVPFKVLKPC